METATISPVDALMDAGFEHENNTRFTRGDVAVVFHPFHYAITKGNELKGIFCRPESDARMVEFATNL